MGEGVELGEGGAALGPQRLRPVQHLRNPPLLRQRRQGNFESRRRARLLSRRIRRADLPQLTEVARCAEATDEDSERLRLSALANARDDSTLLRTSMLAVELTAILPIGLRQSR